MTFNHVAKTNINFIAQMCNVWHRIGSNLGIELNLLDGIQRQEHDDAERMRKVFIKWLDNASGLPNSDKYPLSWCGLAQLLADSGKSAEATEYFNFLDVL